MEFEDAFEIQIPDQDAEKLQTIRDVNDYVTGRLAAEGQPRDRASVYAIVCTITCDQWKSGAVPVDLLTPGAMGHEDPVFIPRFRAAAAPVKYLSLLIDEAEPAPAIYPRGAVLVDVPTPARLALHKLLVSQTRSLVQQTKSGKDLH